MLPHSKTSHALTSASKALDFKCPSLCLRCDDPNADPPPPKHFFCAGRFYCVETICAPCGVVIAWTTFDRGESPTRILNFLGTVYPSGNTNLALAVFSCLWESLIVFAKDWLHVWA